MHIDHLYTLFGEISSSLELPHLSIESAAVGVTGELQIGKSGGQLSVLISWNQFTSNGLALP